MIYGCLRYHLQIQDTIIVIVSGEKGWEKLTYKTHQIRIAAPPKKAKVVYTNFELFLVHKWVKQLNKYFRWNTEER